MGFKGGPGGDIGGRKVTTTNTGSFGTVVITESPGALSAPADGEGGKLYVKSDGKLYWVSNEVSETDLTAGGGSSLTTEQVQDIVGAMFTGNTETGITVTYQDGDGTIDLATDVTANLTNEQVQDIVGAMFTGNTETGITATYEDGDGTIDLVVSGGSSKQTWNINVGARFVIGNSTRLITHADGMHAAAYADYNTNSRTDISSLSDTSFTVGQNNAMRFYTLAVAPFACTMKNVTMTNTIKNADDHDYANPPFFRLWKGTYTNDSTGDVTWNNIIDPVQMTGTKNTIFTSNTTSFGTASFAQGDMIALTLQGDSTLSNKFNNFALAIAALED